MAQYIDKSAVVAEIERLKQGNWEICGGNFEFLKECYPEYYYSTEAYNDILHFLDTLEVKEVDLEKIIKEEYLKRRRYGGKDNMLVILNEPDFNRIAKHFFELGLNARKGE